MIALVGGARPNCVKLAPIMRAMDARGVRHQFVWSGQHRGALDIRDELGMREPDVSIDLEGYPPNAYLDIISMKLMRHWGQGARPKAVVVVGDVTSTLAAALAATVYGIPVVHVEAGLRSADFDMPEERNRILVDRMSDLLLCTERSAEDRLVKETGKPVVFCGHPMIDSLRWAEARIAEDDMRADPKRSVIVALGEPYRGGLPLAATPERPYALVTIHRPSNVDAFAAWERSCKAIDAIRREGINVVIVKHPRQPIEGLAKGTWEGTHSYGGLLTIEPRPYVEMVRLMKDAKFVATDSGGVQEETTALGIPCLTLRENTERPITVTEGTNTVVGLDPARIAEEVRKILGGAGKRGKIPEGWDGHAAVRIVDAIQRRYL